MNKEDKKNAYLYCKFRDEQFALYDEYAKRHGMLMKTLLVVNALFYNKDGMTQTEICKRTFQSKQTVNLIIKNLLSGSYVTVAEVPENKRNKIVQMTAAGRAYCEKVVRHITWAEDTAMSMFTPEELVTLRRISMALMKRIQSNYRFVIGFNGSLIGLGTAGVLAPATSAMLHNLSTLGVSLRSMTNLLDHDS